MMILNNYGINYLVHSQWSANLKVYSIEGKDVLAVNLPQLQHSLTHTLRVVNNTLKALPNLGFPSTDGYARKFLAVVDGKEVEKHLRVVGFRLSFVKDKFGQDFNDGKATLLPG